MSATTPMQYRSIKVDLGLWADAESFQLTRDQIMSAILYAVPGAQVGWHEDAMYVYQVADPKPTDSETNAPEGEL